jgi:hypothetical protein
MITGTVDGNDYASLRCTCGRATATACFFRDAGLHGACVECGHLELVLEPLGKPVRRHVCEKCWRRNRDLIFETAVLAEQGWLIT